MSVISHVIDGLYICMFIFLIMVFVVSGAILKTNKFPYITRSMLTWIVSVLIGTALYLWAGIYFEYYHEAVFYFLIPALLFSVGFNVKRQKFVKNLSWILYFGGLGTFLIFVILASIIYSLSKQHDIKTEGGGHFLSLEIAEILLFAAAMSWGDTIPVVEMLEHTNHEELSSLLAGGGVMSEAIALSLFNTI